MAVSATPVFTQTPKAYIAQVSAANTNRDGTGTTVDVVSGGTNGTKIENIVITGTATSTAGMIRLYLNDGTNTRLWKEVVVTAITASASVACFTSTIDLSFPSSQLVIPNGWKLKASTHNAETFNITAFGWDY